MDKIVVLYSPYSTGDGDMLWQQSSLFGFAKKDARYRRGLLEKTQVVRYLLAFGAADYYSCDTRR